MKHIAVALAFMAPVLGQAQTIPQSCARFIDAFEACGENLGEVKDRAHPTEKSVKGEMKQMAEEMRINTKKSVARDGERVVAQRCEEKAPEVIMQIMTPLILLGAINNQCSVAYARLRMSK